MFAESLEEVKAEKKLVEQTNGQLKKHVEELQGQIVNYLQNIEKLSVQAESFSREKESIVGTKEVLAVENQKLNQSLTEQEGEV